MPVINGKDHGQFLSTVGGKARLKLRKEVPSFKECYRRFFVSLAKSGLVCSVLDPQSPESGKGWNRVSLSILPNAEPGFSSP